MFSYFVSLLGLLVLSLSSDFNGIMPAWSNKFSQQGDTEVNTQVLCGVVCLFVFCRKHGTKLSVDLFLCTNNQYTIK